MFMRTTPAENRKNFRNRPTKVDKVIQPQIKRKRGRPRKNEMF
jgi:hypothetical protein